MAEEVSHLYKITNNITGKYYIGKHNGWHQNNYWGSGFRIKSNIEKYGKENFSYEILCYGTPEYILELESKYVTIELIESDEKCLNLSAGGLGAGRITEKTREKFKVLTSGVKNGMYGKKHSEETRKKISESISGKSLKEETKVKLSKLVSEKIWVNNGKFGKRISLNDLENYKKQGYILGRLPLSENHRKNIGKAVKGRKRKPESILKMKITKRIKKEKLNG